MKFLRYGSLVPQKHTPDAESYHSAPVKYGIYAFPKGFFDSYLLTGMGCGSIENGRFSYLKDDSNKKIKVKLDDLFELIIDNKFGIEERYYHTNSLKFPYNKLLRGLRCYALMDAEAKEIHNNFGYIFKSDAEYFYILKENEPRRFDYNGNIWHHLESFNSKKIVEPIDIIAKSGSWVLTDMKTYEKALNKYISLLKFDKYMTFKKDFNIVDNGSACGMPLGMSKEQFEVFIEKVK